MPKSNFFIMGGLAALRIDPVARNIGGGKMACQRIVPAIVKPSLAFSMYGKTTIHTIYICIR